jgi:hypothetical protein
MIVNQFLPVPLLYLSIYIFIVPQTPLNVTGVATPDPNTLQVTWQQPLPRPGITTYTTCTIIRKVS